MVAPHTKLAELVAVVTGAASGIGNAVAIALLAEGAAVVAVDVDQPGLETLRSRPASRPSSRVEVLVADVTEASQVRAAVSATLSSHHQIDLLVNAAGISTMATVEHLTESAWDHVMAVNAKGVFLMTQAVLPSMTARCSGSIVNIASAAGKRGAAFLAHYSASKFAVIGFTQSVALEVAASRIRVNAICPGLIATPMQEREIEWEMTLAGRTKEEVLHRYLGAVPMGRLGTPSDVASVVLFLASEAAQYITGESINVGGGYLMD